MEGDAGPNVKTSGSRLGSVDRGLPTQVQAHITESQACGGTSVILALGTRR